MATYQNELSVITKTRLMLLHYTVQKISKRSDLPCSKLQNYAISVKDLSVSCKCGFCEVGDIAKAEQRLEYQRQAMTELKLLSYISQLAMQQQCILQKQYEQITKQISDCQNLLGAWMNSDRRRLRI